MYLSIEIQELKQKLVETLNDSKLPFCVKQMILREMQGVIDDLAEKERVNDIIEKKKLEEKEKKDEQGEGA